METNSRPLQLLLANNTMAEEGATSKIAEKEKVEDTMERGKADRKSDNITDTLARAKVTPNGEQNREREQDTPKNLGGKSRKESKTILTKERESAPRQRKGTQ